MQSILTSTAVDIEAPGFDNIAGHGRIDALAAVNAVTAPTTTTTIPSVSTSTISTVVSTTTSTTLPVCDPDDCDGNVCTVGDTCAGAVCQAGSRLTAGQLSGFTLDDTNVATSQCPGDRRKSVKKSTLAPGHPDYRARYDGDLRSRDAAYHQGTVWTWLLGPLIDAWVRATGEDPDRSAWIEEGIAAQLSEACLGQASEIYDAEAPYHPRGCVAQAWSIAELIRCLVVTARR